MVIAGLAAEGFDAVYPGAAAAPEVMARCAADDSVGAFAYVSASHNPLGHNGVKFGLGGGVIGGTDARNLIGEFRALIRKEGAAAALADIAAGRSAVSPDTGEKEKTLAAYLDLLELTAGGPGGEESRRLTLEALRRSLAGNPVTIVADLNGSARCLSADRPWLEGLGARLVTFNDTAGEVAHSVLPEGDALEPCRKALEDAHRKNQDALIGYVPDNDGDRGNLVIWDEEAGGARILEAQEVFALSVLSEFACAEWSDTAEDPAGSTVRERPPSALVVNGPTSHRVRLIARTYGAEVYETEVGEANVVNRAAELREGGYRVRLLGEGSNGGTITHPAEVRDPMNTLTALLKLLRLPSAPGHPSPFEDWCVRIGRPEAWRAGFGPSDILASLPVFTTTPSSAERALMAISCPDHNRLKSEWEEIFRLQWSIHSSSLKKAYGFSDWIELNNEGTVSRAASGPSARTGAGTGGLKVVFRDRRGEDAGFLWMRGSGTEPVFRVMAEIRGSRPEAERALIAWHRAMVAEADRRTAGASGVPVEIPSPVV
jgi:phosphomannomutase